MIHTFQNIINSYFKQYGRQFPFREMINPYYVVVSEVMLQQTQTSTVSEKFLNFIARFPDFHALAQAPLDEVLKAWHGLGYNRRAIALKNIAEIVMNEYDGILPDSLDSLKKLPQIGHNTASSILAFAFNKPTVFVETNIRRVYIYFFFSSQNEVKDNDIMPLVEATVNNQNPRNWYYALMDYGVMLKKTQPELNKRSAHYRKQAPFKGSNREIRGKILKILISKKSIEISKLTEQLKIETSKIIGILEQMNKEGFVKVEKEKVIINQ